MSCQCINLVYLFFVQKVFFFHDNDPTQLAVAWLIPSIANSSLHILPPCCPSEVQTRDLVSTPMQEVSLEFAQLDQEVQTASSGDER